MVEITACKEPYEFKEWYRITVMQVYFEYQTLVDIKNLRDRCNQILKERKIE